ncbi:MAG: hypothetical protein ABWY23_08230 [Mycetocola sp.]
MSRISWSLGNEMLSPGSSVASAAVIRNRARAWMPGRGQPGRADTSEPIV